MDHTRLLKRNFITLMNLNYDMARTDPVAMHRANHYAQTLLLLPCHPILSENDLHNVIENAPEPIISQLKTLMQTKEDLPEVSFYLKNGRVEK
jgi:bacterioferritin (cytochrome b1)